MPLKRGRSQKTIAYNIRVLVEEEGYTRREAVAMALEESKKTGRQKR